MDHICEISITSLSERRTYSAFRSVIFNIRSQDFKPHWIFDEFFSNFVKRFCEIELWRWTHTCLDAQLRLFDSRIWSGLGFQTKITMYSLHELQQSAPNRPYPNQGLNKDHLMFFLKLSKITWNIRNWRYRMNDRAISERKKNRFVVAEWLGCSAAASETDSVSVSYSLT